MKKQFTLGKTERLKSRKQIEQLFNEGKKFVQAPFRVHYLFSENDVYSLQFAVGVNSKNFKRAVDRNRIKRLTKEAYRLQKTSLQQKLKDYHKSLNLFFVYTGKAMPEYKPVFDVVGKVLDKLTKQFIPAT